MLTFCEKLSSITFISREIKDIMKGGTKIFLEEYFSFSFVCLNYFTDEEMGTYRWKTLLKVKLEKKRNYQSIFISSLLQIHPFCILCENGSRSFALFFTSRLGSSLSRGSRREAARGKEIHFLVPMRWYTVIAGSNNNFHTIINLLSSYHLPTSLLSTGSLNLCNHQYYPFNRWINWGSS